jgi:hypothetical protein
MQSGRICKTLPKLHAEVFPNPLHVQGLVSLYMGSTGALNEAAGHKVDVKA